MDCCQCDGIENTFGEKEANSRLKAYRRNGPAKTTRLLLEALKGQGVTGMTLLDIGGGVGVIHHELLRAGLDSATGVDASAAYVRAAHEEAQRLGHADRIKYHHANFVDLAAEVQPADIVTLDRVICCYRDMPGLVGLSVQKAGKLYGLIYPRDTWWVRAAIRLGNFWLRVLRNPFRGYVHATAAVDGIVRDSGLTQSFYKTSGPWQVVVYAR